MTPTAQLAADRVSPIRLSDSVVVTVTVTGPSPLRVEVPTQPLTKDSQDRWKIVPVNAPVSSGSGTEATWTQRFRCEPYEDGEKVGLEFEKLSVVYGGRADTVLISATPNPLVFQVETAWLGATAESARPATGVEAMPATREPAQAASALWAIAGAAMFIGLAAVLTLLRRKRILPSLPPWQVAQNEIVAAGPSPPSDVIMRVLRAYLQQRFHLPSDKATTQELLRLAEARFGELVMPLASILNDCDAVRFGGLEANAELLAKTGSRANSWIQEVERQTGQAQQNERNEHGVRLPS